MARLFFIALVVLPLTVLAQSAPKPPVLLKQVPPEYPASQLDGGSDAAVVLEIDIGTDGRVMKVNVVQSAGEDFDAAAVAAAEQLEFEPAEYDGAPVAVRIQYTSRFFAPVPELIEEPDAGVEPQVNFSGELLAAGTREPVAGAQLSIGEVVVDADEAGRFEFPPLPPGEVEVTVVAPGFEKFTEVETLVEGERTEVRYVMMANDDTNVTVVRATRDRKEVSQVKLTAQEFRMVAGTRNDAFKVVQNLPGVARSPFGGAALVVRGSKAWDSRSYVDEIQIPQLFHFAGLNATFNTAMVETIGFTPGNFGADYGRSIGGLVQADVRTPSKSKVHGAVDLNFFDVSAHLETPVTENWSASAAGRFGLAQFTVPFAINAFAPPETQGSLGFARAPQFWDYQVRVERREPNSKNRVFITVFGSSDSWAFLRENAFTDDDIEGNQGAANSSQLYNRLVVGVDQRLSDRVTFISRNSVGFDVSEQQGATNEIFYKSTLIPIQLRERFRIDIPEANLVLGAGLDALITPAFLDAQQPPPFAVNQIPEPYLTRRLVSATERTVYVEPGLFAEATWTPTTRFSLNGGVRFDGEAVVMQKVWVNPRLTARYAFLDDATHWFSYLALKAGAGLYQQPPDYRAGLLSPTFGNPNLKPEGAAHFMLGAETRFVDLIEFNVQGYYKYLFDQTRQVFATGAYTGSDLNIAGNNGHYESVGYGVSYGAEFLLRIRPTRYFVGWVAYTLSRFERDYYGGVLWAPGQLDQPHNLIVVGSFTLPYGFNVGLRFRYASGPLVTPYIGSVFDANGGYFIALPRLPWSERLPDFIQLDARIDKRFVFDAWTLVIYADVQNVTNQQNPEALYYNYDYSKRAYVNGIPILPTLGLRGEW